MNMTVFEALNLVVALLAILVSMRAYYLIHNFDIKINQYKISTDEMQEIIKSFYKKEHYIDELLVKYSIEADQLMGRISSEEKLKLNRFIYQINLGLAKIFIITADDKYQNLADNWPLTKVQLCELRENITVLFRKMQHPETRFNERKDIKLIHKI